MMHDSIADAPWQPSAPYAGQPLHCGNRWVCICVCICICISIVFVFVFVYVFVFVSYAGQPLHCGDRWQIINPLPKKSGIFISLEAQIRSIYVLYIFGSARIIFTPRNGETAKNSVSQSFGHRHNCLSCRVSLMGFFMNFLHMNVYLIQFVQLFILFQHNHQLNEKESCHCIHSRDLLLPLKCCQNAACQGSSSLPFFLLLCHSFCVCNCQCRCLCHCHCLPRIFYIQRQR